MINYINVTKKYEHDVVALDNINVHIDKGEFVFLVGPSGSGKSTFLKLLLKEELPTSGSILLEGKDLALVKEKDVPYIRRRMGCVFQDFRLLYDKTVYENIVFALRIVGASDREIRSQTDAVLEMMGIKEKANFYPNQLSGGEQQRVGLARAIATRPPIIIADEPTGNLDDATAEEIMKILYEINARGTTVLMVTHNRDIVNRSNKRVIQLDRGHIIKDSLGGK